MLVGVARSSIDIVSTTGPANSNTYPIPLPPLMRAGQQMQHHVLGRHPVGEASLEADEQASGRGQTTGSRHERVGHLRGAAVGEAAERPGTRRMRIRADDDLAGQGVALGHHRKGDALGPFLARQIAVVPQPILLGEDAGRLRKIPNAAEQALPDMGRAAAGVGVVILEQDDRIGVVQRQPAAKRACSMWAAMLV